VVAALGFEEWGGIVVIAVIVVLVVMLRRRPHWVRRRPGFRLSQQPGATGRDDFLRESMSNIAYDDRSDEEAHGQVDDR
jgi:hypothetical protein